MKEVKLTVDKKSRELVVEGIDPVVCQEQLGGKVDFSGRCRIRAEIEEREEGQA